MQILDLQEIKTFGNRTGGRLGNQLFYVLQAYCYTKRNGKKYKYVPIDSYAIKTDICKFAKDLNIEEYISQDTSHVDDIQPFNCYYQMPGKDFTFEELKGFIESTIRQSDFIKAKLAKSNDHNSAAIHIRNGDYLKIPLYQVFDRMQYMKKAFHVIPDSVNSIYVFSDDNDLNKKMYSSTFEQRFQTVEYVASSNECEDLLKLSTFKNKILWNSTFSIWSAYIGETIFNDQVVVIPSKFDANNEMAPRTFCNWIKI